MANAADSTFEQIWRRLLLYAPELPIPLAQEFVNSAYSRALTRYRWSQTRKLGAFTIPALYTTGTITTTQGSTAVVGSGTVWTSAMVGRQLFLSSGAFYTIETFTDATNIVLDRPFAEASGA